MMDHAVANGITFFDTASAYSAGGSEKVVGAWLAARQPASDSVVIATKITKPYVAAEIEARMDQSLERLGVKQVGLFYLHTWTDNAADPEILAALDRVVRSGKAKTIGVSNFTAEQLEKVLAIQKERGWARMQAIQNNQNYALRLVDDKLKALCTREDVAIVTYSPLGAGFLTGKYNNKVVPAGTRFDVIPGHQPLYFNDYGWARLAELEAASTRSGLSQVDLAYAWVLQQKEVDCVLVGGRNTSQIDGARAALRLDPAVVARAFAGT
jgi:aryl-alcohol dehydrogenase-like predicted oxidoreductase